MGTNPCLECDIPDVNENIPLECELPGIVMAGADGKSAYELACERGFRGTIDDFLKSLNGDQGVGIQRMYQLEESEADEGMNVFRFILTDGRRADLIVRNGSQGPVGEVPEELFAKIDTMEADIADLKYKPMEIGSFTVTPATAERGAVVDAVTFNWARNKVPVRLTLEGAGLAEAVVLENEAVSHQLTGRNITCLANTIHSWKLRAVDERSAAAERTASLTFLNRIYYGAAAAPAAVDSDFVTSLANKPLSDNKKRTVNINAPAGQYIWYCIPKRLGTCTFKANGFTGGFDTVQEVLVINALGYGETYYVYRSDETGLNLPLEVS